MRFFVDYRDNVVWLLAGKRPIYSVPIAEFRLLFGDAAFSELIR